ncbi:unnamed protein product, partial [Effrenium voratum]
MISAAQGWPELVLAAKTTRVDEAAGFCGYPCPEHPALMMYSPSGVFSSYDIGREVVQHGDGLRFADGADARPAHVHRMESFEDAVAHMCERPSDVQFSAGEVPVKYLRQGFPERQRREVLEEMGLNPGLFADFSAYCS